MSSKRTYLLIILFVTLAKCEDWEIDFPLGPFSLFDSMSPFAENCTKAGYMCYDCESTAYCLDRSTNGNKIFFQTPPIKCGAGETCMKSTGKCVKEYNIDCDLNVQTFDFECMYPGIFPDPYDCRKYHICSNFTGDSVEMKCPPPMGFSLETMLCTVNLTGQICKPRVDVCNTTGLYPVKGHPRLHYLCFPIINGTQIKYHPRFLYCNGNEIFLDGFCVDSNASQGLLPTGKCPSAGKFYYPKCNAYNNCRYANDTPALTYCANGFRFDFQTMACVQITCPN